MRSKCEQVLIGQGCGSKCLCGGGRGFPYDLSYWDPLVNRQTDMTEHITFPHCTIAGGTKNLSVKGRSKAFIFPAPTHTQFLDLLI